MSRRILCKFFAHGACLKGEHCEFAHDWKAPSNNICTYYQKGVCAYGSRCRYDHVKVHRPESSTSYLSTSAGHRTSDTSSCFTTPSEVACSELHISPASVASSPSKSAWTFPSENFDDASGDDYVGPVNSGLVDRVICSFAAAGNCPRGDKCPHIHGDQCPSCGKHCLHPFSPDERDEHMISCERKQKYLNSLTYSQEIECSVCLERVLSKSSASERKFGLLSECDHPFCISCIRNWRSSSPTSGMDVNSALRACPICRKLSYFVIPSVIWYATKEEKQEIIIGYKSRLKSIDCKYFDYGSGSCPFGSSCFYKHAYRDGRLEEVVLRHLGAADGDTVIAKDIRLSEFLSGFSGLRLR